MRSTRGARGVLIRWCVAVTGLATVAAILLVAHATPATASEGSLLPPYETANDRDIAFAHAPIHYQDTYKGNPQPDFISAFNYDGDWEGTNNWDNLYQFELPAVGYFSITETCTHYFVVYGFFHPRDWDGGGSDNQEHENDMEGTLAIVRKDGTAFGTLEGIITTVHSDFNAFVPAGSPLVLRVQDQDDPAELQMAAIEGPNGTIRRPITAAEDQGHAIKAWPFVRDFIGEPGQDGVIYYPNADPDAPGEVPNRSGDDREVLYHLESFDDLYFRQLLEAYGDFDGATTYHDWGHFRGDRDPGCGGDILDSCKPDAASPAWGWDDGNDATPTGDSFEGEMAIDPASLADLWFDYLPDSSGAPRGTFSHYYARNFYLEQLPLWGFSSETDDQEPSGWNYHHNIEALVNTVIGVDPDGDGLSSCDELAHKTDPNVADSDGDGFADGVEVEADSDPNDPASVPNRDPVAADDAYEVIGGESLTVTSPGVLANDSDPDGDPLAAVAVSGPAYGALSLNGDGSFTYAPREDFHGADSFSYRASDGERSSEVATVTITVHAGCAGLAATVVGTPGDDKLIGTAGADVMVGFGGNDKILSQGGDDVVCGGSGNDELNGNSGDDRLFGGSGGDILRGDVGNDALDGGLGRDNCYGDVGLDTATNCERRTGVP